METKNKTTAISIMYVLAIIFGIVALICVYFAYYKITYYDNTDYGTSVNVYVGGDAYNYIINGTYFAGLMAAAGASGIISVLLFLGAQILHFMPVMPDSITPKQQVTTETVTKQEIKEPVFMTIAEMEIKQPRYVCEKCGLQADKMDSFCYKCGGKIIKKD